MKRIRRLILLMLTALIAATCMTGCRYGKDYSFMYTGNETLLENAYPDINFVTSSNGTIYYVDTGSRNAVSIIAVDADTLKKKGKLHMRHVDYLEVWNDTLAVQGSLLSEDVPRVQWMGDAPDKDAKDVNAFMLLPLSLELDDGAKACSMLYLAECLQTKKLKRHMRTLIENERMPQDLNAESVLSAIVGVEDERLGEPFDTLSIVDARGREASIKYYNDRCVVTCVSEYDDDYVENAVWKRISDTMGQYVVTTPSRVYRLRSNGAHIVYPFTYKGMAGYVGMMKDRGTCLYIGGRSVSLNDYGGLCGISRIIPDAERGLMYIAWSTGYYDDEDFGGSDYGFLESLLTTGYIEGTNILCVDIDNMEIVRHLYIDREKECVVHLDDDSIITYSALEESFFRCDWDGSVIERLGKFKMRRTLEFGLGRASADSLYIQLCDGYIFVFDTGGINGDLHTDLVSKVQLKAIIPIESR